LTWGLFDRLANRYEDWFARNRVTARNELLAVLEADPGQRPCVDIGSGTGFFTGSLGCLGVEPSIGMAALGRVLRRVDAVQGRAESAPLRSESMSVAFIVVTLCFLPTPKEAVLEAYRVLKPGGWAVPCIVPSESSWGRRYEAEAKEGHPFYSAARFLSFGEVVDMFTSAGFRLDKAVGTLAYGPDDEPRPEVPTVYTGREGFVCMRFKKVGRQLEVGEEARKG
jgi:ubiquinone/menaquinone biosynthesis C-methylase UbiE